MLILTTLIPRAIPGGTVLVAADKNVRINFDLPSIVHVLSPTSDQLEPGQREKTSCRASWAATASCKSTLNVQEITAMLTFIAITQRW